MSLCRSFLDLCQASLRPWSANILSCQLGMLELAAGDCEQRLLLLGWKVVETARLLGISTICRNVSLGKLMTSRAPASRSYV